MYEQSKAAPNALSTASLVFEQHYGRGCSLYGIDGDHVRLAVTGE